MTVKHCEILDFKHCLTSAKKHIHLDPLTADWYKVYLARTLLVISVDTVRKQSYDKLKAKPIESINQKPVSCCTVYLLRLFILAVDTPLIVCGAC